MGDKRLEGFKKFLKKIVPGIIVAAAISFLVAIYAPMELYASSQRDFWFSLETITPGCIVLFFLLWLVLSGIFALMRKIGKKAFAISIIVGFTLFLAFYIQGNFLVADLPPLDGTTVEWGRYWGERVKSIGLLVLIGGALTFVYIKWKLKMLKKVVTIGCAALGSILVITFATFMLTTEFEDKNIYLEPTDYNDFQYSTDKNLIVLVIDATDDDVFADRLAKYSEFDDTFDDFRRYDNALAGYPFTLHSMPFMFSGEWYENEQSYAEYTELAFEKSPLVKKIKDDGYKAGFYNDGEVYFKKGGVGEVFENQKPLKPRFKNPIYSFGTILKMSAIRYAPWDLKSFGYNVLWYSGQGRDIMTKEFGNVKNSNAVFYGAMKEQNPIETVDEKCVRIIHLEGSHVPHKYNKDVEILDEYDYQGNYEGTVDACLTICDKYIERLKESGVYDNSAIVILADHGFVSKEHPTVSMGDLRGRMNPVLFVKGIGDKGDSLTVDSTPVAFENLADAFTKLMDGAPAEGLFDEYVTEERRFLWYRFLHEDHMVEYVTSGRADDVNSMKETGKEYNLE